MERVVPCSDKRKSDIAGLGAGDVVETGLGEGEDSVPVEGLGRSERDRGLLALTLGVCVLVVGVLTSLLSVHVYRYRREAKAGIKRLAADLEGQPKKAYEVCLPDEIVPRLAQRGGG